MNGEKLGDLREKLALRLTSVVHLGPYAAETFTEHRQTFLSLADECIRQMKWSRADGFSLANLNSLVHGYGHPVESINHHPLTLAPPDWEQTA